MAAWLTHYLAEKRKIKRGKVMKDKTEKKEVTKIFQRVSTRIIIKKKIKKELDSLGLLGSDLFSYKNDC